MNPEHIPPDLIVETTPPGEPSMSTEPSVEELRKWSAEWMGWDTHSDEFGNVWFGWVHRNDWQPDENIEDAWLLVEKLNEQFHMRLTTPFMPDCPYFAGFTPHGVTGWNGRPDIQAHAPTAAMAITLAAYRAAHALKESP